MTTKIWLAFTPDTTPEHARAAFLARYGVQPSEIIRTGGALLAGPVTPPASGTIETRGGVRGVATPPSPAPPTATLPVVEIFPQREEVATPPSPAPPTATPPAPAQLSLFKGNSVV